MELNQQPRKYRIVDQYSEIVVYGPTERTGYEGTFTPIVAKFPVRKDDDKLALTLATMVSDVLETRGIEEAIRRGAGIVENLIAGKD